MAIDSLFLQMLNMSITASYVILAILLVRLVLRKAPKKFSYALWGVVAFRLLSPVSISSVISIFQLKQFNVAVTMTDNASALVYVPGIQSGLFVLSGSAGNVIHC